MIHKIILIIKMIIIIIIIIIIKNLKKLRFTKTTSPVASPVVHQQYRCILAFNNIMTIIITVLMTIEQKKRQLQR